jgi:hypothetical protein
MLDAMLASELTYFTRQKFETIVTSEYLGVPAKSVLDGRDVSSDIGRRFALISQTEDGCESRKIIDKDQITGVTTDGGMVDDANVHMNELTRTFCS